MRVVFVIAATICTLSECYLLPMYVKLVHFHDVISILAVSF